VVVINTMLSGKISAFTYKYCKVLDMNGIDYIFTDPSNESFWRDVARSELFINFLGLTPIIKAKQAMLTSIINVQMGIPTLPNWHTAWHFDDKIAQSAMLKSYGANFVPYWVFWDKDTAMDWIKEASFPLVFKLNGGAGSLNVVKVNDIKHARLLIKMMFGRGIMRGGVPGGKLFSTYKYDFRKILRNEAKKFTQSIGLKYSALQDWSRDRGYVYFQKFMPNNSYDTRVTVIFGKAFAYIRENRPNDFRSSGSGNLDFDTARIDERCIKIAQSISKHFKFQTMAYDFLLDDTGNPVINEFCCQFIDDYLYRCKGYWDENLVWHEGHFWPQYMQLKALLGNDDLIQPELKVTNGPAHYLNPAKFTKRS